MEFAEIMSNIINVNIMTFLIVIFILIIFRYIKNYASKQVKENATVVALYETTSTLVSRYRGEYNTTNYVIKFDTGKKVLTFFVLYFVYGSLSKGEKGILIYKGEKYIGFE